MQGSGPLPETGPIDSGPADAQSRPGPTRRFAIGDAMIVVALAAFLLAWFSYSPSSKTLPGRVRNYFGAAPGLIRHLYFSGPQPATHSRSTPGELVSYVWLTPVNILFEIGLPPLFLSTLAFLLIRLRKPRPPWTILLRQPGTAAMLAVAFEIVVEVDIRWFGVEVPTPTPVNTAVAVIAAWLILGITRLWRTEPSWVDRLGRVLGVCWIVLGVLAAVEIGWGD